jgi:cytochrome c peroxidase
MPLRLRSLFLCAALIIAPALHTHAADASDAYLVMFRPLPTEAASKDNELTEAKIALGRMLFFDKRMSKNQDISCNTCHNVAKYGADITPTSTGHKGQRSTRNAPSVYHAALHLAQCWDGRQPTVEAQAKGHVLTPNEMAMVDEDHVLKVLNSIPGYITAFSKAFPADTAAVSYDNFGKAIGAFERRLLTPSPWDAYLKGDKAAMTNEERKGLADFTSIGCVNCHNGVGVGGHLYQKLGLAKAWPGLKDLGRFDATKAEVDKHFFKVPSLRNITETGPYLHDGSIVELPQMVKMMAEYQLARQLTDDQANSIIAFLKAMKGKLPDDYIKEPELPAGTAATPAADPS